MPPSTTITTLSDSLHYSSSMLYTAPNTAYVCSLTPLREHSEKALVCTDAGLETIRLIEVRIDWGGVYGEVQLYHSADCFRSPRFKAKLAALPAHANLTSATFAVKYPGDVAWRRVIIRPPDAALYESHTDRIRIEPWLIKRQFLQLR